MNRILAIAAFVCLSATSAFAGQSLWQQVAPGARLRVISSDALRDGTTRIALELTMQPELKTYWRIPGESGIPTQVTVTSGGAPITAQIQWPLPEWDVAAGYVDYVYRGELVLPVELQLPAGGASQIDVEAIMGVCSDICVPVKATFTMSLDFSKSDIGQELRILQAEAMTPVTWGDAADPFGSIRFDDTSGELLLDYDPAIIDPAQLFVTVDGSSQIFGPPRAVGGTTGRISMQLISRHAGAGLEASDLRLTFMTAGGAYEIVRAL